MRLLCFTTIAIAAVAAVPLSGTQLQADADGLQLEVFYLHILSLKRMNST